MTDSVLNHEQRGPPHKGDEPEVIGLRTLSDEVEPSLLRGVRTVKMLGLRSCFHKQHWITRGLQRLCKNFTLG